MAQPFIPPPPRLTGDYASDAAALSQWLSEFHKNVVGDPGAFDGANLTAPTQATISTAQQTANEAYKLAQEAKKLAEE